MPGFLRQSTASQSRSLGPFIDDTDFKTAKTGLTIANTDVKLIPNGGSVVNKNSGGGTHQSSGVYGVTFNATDTGTIGELKVVVIVAGALPVFDTFTVLHPLVYDSMFGAGPAFPLFGVIHSGTGQAATGTTYQMDSGATFADNTLIGATLLALGSTQGYYQSRSVVSNVGSTDTLTVDTFSVTPSGTLTHVVFGGGPASASLIPDVNVTK